MLRRPTADRLGVFLSRMAAVGGAAALLVLRHGWREPLLDSSLLLVGFYVLIVAATGALLHTLARAWPARQRGEAVGSLIVEAVAAALMWGTALYSIRAATFVVCLWLTLLLLRSYLTIVSRLHRPGLLFVGGFALLILIGTAALKLPVTTPLGEPINWLDSLFTSTSAVCVTGLIVRDTATQFTPVGQLIILALIQLGGLGIVTYAAFVLLLSGSPLSFKQSGSLAGPLTQEQFGRVIVGKLVWFIGLSTLLFELLGVISLLGMWSEGLPWSERLFHSTFMSISAFCNAGFAVLSDSLVSYRWHWATHLVIAPLIVLGGLGFPVLFNLFEIGCEKFAALFRPPGRRQSRRLWIRLTLHTKLVLIATLVLYMAGTAGVLIGQGFSQDVIDPVATALQETLTAPQRLMDASFLSITSRTAGFNSMPMSELTPASRFVVMLLMFVGGSPGSTAGGVKTMTVVIMAMLVWSTLRNRAGPEAFGRRVSVSIVQRSATLIMMGLATIAAVVLLLLITEAAAFLTIAFEAVSACSTVGLSLGVTDALSSSGRVVIIVGMFAGRLGPLALLAALLGRPGRLPWYEYPEEGVVVG